MKFLKEGFDVFVLASFEDKSGCRNWDLLEFVKNLMKTFWNDKREWLQSSFDRTKAAKEGFRSINREV